MDVKDAYDAWSATYDTMENWTRDSEGRALREMVPKVLAKRNVKKFNKVLEIGCGTGKNTLFLADCTDQLLLSVDFSPEMMNLARTKVRDAGMEHKVEFLRADILDDASWKEISERGPFDLVTFSLVLEHIPQIAPVFARLAPLLTSEGRIYMGELPPCRQYKGTGARFGGQNGEKVKVLVYVHHISEFVKAAEAIGMRIEQFEEHFRPDEVRTWKERDSVDGEEDMTV